MPVLDFILAFLAIEFNNDDDCFLDRMLLDSDCYCYCIKMTQMDDETLLILIACLLIADDSCELLPLNGDGGTLCLYEEFLVVWGEGKMLYVF